MKVVIYGLFFVTLTFETSQIIKTKEENIMANKRNLKTAINCACEEMFIECVAVSLYGNNRDGAKTLLTSIVKLQSEFTSRISHPEPGMPAKVYFKKLREDFAAQANELIDQINNM